MEDRLNRGDVKFDDLYRLVQQVADSQRAITNIQAEQARSLKQVAEVINAWNNAKGFVSTLRFIVKICGWMAFFSGVAYAIYHFGRTGDWRPPPLP